MKKLLLVLGLVTVTAAAFAQQVSRITPSYYSSTSRGALIGSLKSIVRSDDNYLTFIPFRQAPIAIEVGAFVRLADPVSDDVASLDDMPQALHLSVKSFVGSARTVPFEIQMLEWDSNQWVTVYSTKTSGNSIVNVSVDFATFVHPKTNMTRSRLVWTPVSRVKAVGVDSVVWSVE